MRTYRTIAALLFVGLLGACVSSAEMPDRPLPEDAHLRMDEVTIRNMEVARTATRAQVRTPNDQDGDGVQDVYDHTFFDKAPSWFGETSKGVLTTGIPSVINGIFGWLAVDRKADAIENRKGNNTTFHLHGGNSLSVSDARSGSEAAVDIDEEQTGCDTCW